MHRPDRFHNNSQCLHLTEQLGGDSTGKGEDEGDTLGELGGLTGGGDCCTTGGDWLTIGEGDWITIGEADGETGDTGGDTGGGETRGGLTGGGLGFGLGLGDKFEVSGGGLNEGLVMLSKGLVDLGAEEKTDPVEEFQPSRKRTKIINSLHSRNVKKKEDDAYLGDGDASVLCGLAIDGGLGEGDAGDGDAMGDKERDILTKFNLLFSGQ
ncbi:hypothetical protein HK098_004088 [Nowakowskiella sp. JEL0407]|nr:hypothetical protein HK098_004088 [Nowakowskiella sp. JEL0407]